MAVTVTATAKGTTSNSYVTLAEADAYFEGRLDVSEWDAATTDNQNRALVMATNRLEQEDYFGTPTDSDQRLKWPRSGVWDSDGRVWDQDEVPRPVKEATYELALALTVGDLELKDTGLEGFRNVAVGALNVTPAPGFEGGRLPKQVLRLLEGLRVGYAGLNLRVDRG